MARLNGRHAELTEKEGPLALGSQRIYLHTLKEMLRGGRYTRAMNNGDADYFLGRIERDFGPDGRNDALSAIDQHITYYNALGKGNLIGARALYDRWRAKSGNDTTLPSLDAGFRAAVSASLTLDPTTRAKQSSSYPETPTKRLRTITTYDRNPHIVAQALVRANGICEACEATAPFARRSDNSAYLEVHHMVPLAAGGLDKLENLIALCPNCHREAHHGQNMARFLKLG